ncbi:uncharacterized protein KY384_005338 [Bacidia gigantensis]|uniref:uncharacterized protein n=1 Tax=Bacidia gigantensis TaxID=2732470 RepID=UPI001D03A8E9|nr:uncharacterized protein KY384_005338 [Bacidia gigantensis]KAG8529857.1 hypothetical protein KY384_005338 [Bacidia gigantensis]
MASSQFRSTQHNSEQLVESAGAILFQLSTKRICLLHLVARDEYVLAKGRRNIGESRQQAAIREVKEETGYVCRLLPVTLGSRAPPAIETDRFVGDVLHVYEGVTEPFTLQIRHLQPEGDLKLIWWFIAVVDEDKAPEGERGPGEEKFSVEFYGFDEAVEKLTFKMDRELVQRAINIVKGSGYGSDNVEKSMLTAE